MRRAMSFNEHYLAHTLPLAGLLLPTRRRDPDRHELLRHLRHGPGFFWHLEQGEGLSPTEPLLAILGSLCGLRPGSRVKISESDELRFRFLFSCAVPPSLAPGFGSEGLR
jgi:hypothetical protein